MTTFKPVNEDHAVTGVTFQIKLDEFVEPPVLQEAVTSDFDWKGSLPAMQQIPPVTINVGGQQFEVPALQFAVVRPDGRPLWALRFSGFELTVECTAYTRWADVWTQARGYLEQAWTLVRKHQTDANILEIKLQVVDRFTTEEHPYTATDLFVEGELLGSRLLQRGGIWHSNMGWFDEDTDLRLLHTMNVQARGKRSSDGKSAGPYSFVITHAQQATMWPSAPMPFERLDQIISDMHTGNKAEITKLLTQPILEKIGLGA